MAMFEGMSQEEIAALPGFKEALANNPEFQAAIAAKLRADEQPAPGSPEEIHQGEGVFKGRTRQQIGDALTRDKYFESPQFADAVEEYNAGSPITDPDEPFVGGGGGGPPDPFQPPPMNAPPVNWQNYADSQSGNEDFYAQQAQALKGQNADLMGRQYAAQQSRDTQDAARNAEAAARREAGPVDPWAWANLGAPAQAYWGGEDGEPGYTWDRDPNIETGMTNQQLLESLYSSGKIDRVDYDILNESQNLPDRRDYEGPARGGESTFWSGSDWADPEAARKGIFAGQLGELDPAYSGALNKLANAMFDNRAFTTPTGGGPTAAQGYTLPISWAKAGTGE